MSMHNVDITPRGPFTLAASARFLEGFTPARYRGGTGAPGQARLRLAFPVEGSWQTAGVLVTQPDRGTVRVEVDGAEAEAVRGQVARMLSLDIDGSGFAAVRQADPVVDRVAGRYPGLRPVCFPSPYEAACWAVIGQRIRMTQAATITERIATTFGQNQTVDGVELAAFPDPYTLHRVAGELPLPAVKTRRLRGIADAAIDGQLDGARLRGMDHAEALHQLQRLEGIGPFAAELVLVRGAGAPDVFPTREHRLHDAMRQAYELLDADVARLRDVAGAWSPYRSWVALLLRADRPDTAGKLEP